MKITRWTVAVLSATILASACGGASRETRESRRPSREAHRAGAQAGASRPAPGKPPIPATPEALLGRDEVTRLQRSLAGRGLLGQHQQGELDRPTRQAVRKFQDQQGLAATGVPDRETLRKLDVETGEGRGAGGER